MDQLGHDLKAHIHLAAGEGGCGSLPTVGVLAEGAPNFQQPQEIGPPCWEFVKGGGCLGQFTLSFPLKSLLGFAELLRLGLFRSQCGHLSILSGRGLGMALDNFVPFHTLP